VCKQILIDAKLKTGKRGQKTQLMRTSALDCRAIEEKEEEDWK
jgi:hypothetical protein